MAGLKATLHIMAVDCCQHTLAALTSVPSARLTSIVSQANSHLLEHTNGIDLIVIGVSRYPVRRLFISQLRSIYLNVPILILRREENGPENIKGRVRGEFILSDQRRDSDYEIVNALREILPLASCEHTHKGYNYDIVREVVRVIAQNYSDPQLDLARVAKELPMSPARLSRILNQQVGVSFRQLLRHTRIEEAKRMLATRRYSVKEVAARVGFTDSHYFSRSFKELAGLSASQYQSQDVIFG